jgi:Zn finger protein HypA/HybF involved in hydrogenase expression
MNVDRANFILGKAIAGFQEDEISDLATTFDDIEDPDLEGIEEAGKGGKTSMQCMDCGHQFKKKLGPRTTEVKCPECGSYDTEIV